MGLFYSPREYSIKSSPSLTLSSRCPIALYSRECTHHVLTQFLWRLVAVDALVLGVPFNTKSRLFQ